MLTNVKRCINCGQDFDWDNCRTLLDWKETQLSGLCGKCFDTCTKEVDEYDQKEYNEWYEEK